MSGETLPDGKSSSSKAIIYGLGYEIPEVAWHREWIGWSKSGG